jgi:hypothetical protein
MCPLCGGTLHSKEEDGYLIVYCNCGYQEYPVKIGSE